MWPLVQQRHRTACGRVRHWQFHRLSSRPFIYLCMYVCGGALRFCPENSPVGVIVSSLGTSQPFTTPWKILPLFLRLPKITLDTQQGFMIPKPMSFGIFSASFSEHSADRLVCSWEDWTRCQWSVAQVLFLPPTSCLTLDSSFTSVVLSVIGRQWDGWTRW